MTPIATIRSKCLLRSIPPGRFPDYRVAECANSIHMRLRSMRCDYNACMWNTVRYGIVGMHEDMLPLLRTFLLCYLLFLKNYLKNVCQ